MMFRNIAALAACLSVCAAADAQETGQEMTLEFPPELGARINAAFDAEMAGFQAMECAENDLDCLSAELIERFRVDQWAREQFFSPEICGEYAQSHPQQCQMQVMGTTAFRGDAPNLARLKEIMAAHGWPSPPGFDPEAQRGAWYIAQHGQYIDETGTTQWDADFAESILPEVMEAVAREELTPWAYAAMYDRIQRTRGLPQRYATQIMCEDGRAAFGALEDEARITEFRAEIGMQAFDQAAYDAHCSTG